MTPEEKYLFDLQGYLVVRQVLSDELLGRINETIDELEKLDDEAVAARGAARKYVQDDNVYAQKGVQTKGLGDYNCNALGYGGVFEELVDLPTTLPYIDEMIGEPCRLDAVSFLSRNSAGALRRASTCQVDHV